MTNTEKIQNRIKQGYTITLYGTREAMYYQMYADLIDLEKINKALTPIAVSHQRELLDFIEEVASDERTMSNSGIREYAKRLLKSNCR